MRSTRLLVCLVLGAACAKAPPPQLSTAVRIDEVRRMTRDGQWARALPLLQGLQFELAGGRPELPEVSYLTGEAFFQTGSFVEAANQFRDLAGHFPESPYAPLALLRAGDSNMRLWRRPMLDPTYGEAALAAYQELNTSYPESEAASRAGARVYKLRTMMAEKTFLNGSFYFRRKAYDSAILYFREVVAGFSDTEWATPALLRLVDSYYIIEYNEERKETCAHLRRFFPQTRLDPAKCPAETPAAAAASP